MNWVRIEDDWKRFKVSAKQRWAKLTEDQLNAIAGRRPLLAGRIRDVYAISSDDAERQLSDWQARLHDEQLASRGIALRSWDRIDADWVRCKEIVRLHWSKLTDKQLDAIAGRRDRLVDALQAAYGMSREQTEDQLANWQASRPRGSAAPG